MAGIQRPGVHGKWYRKHGKAGDGAWSAASAAALIILPIILAIVASSAFLFVALGPIIFQLIERPLAPGASPRNTIIANGIALILGYASLAVFGLLDAPSTLEEGVTVIRGIAVLVAFAVTLATLASLDLFHVPAGSTVLFVTLGFMTPPGQLAIVFASIVLVSACGVVLGRLARIPVPAWKPQDEHEPLAPTMARPSA